MICGGTTGETGILIAALEVEIEVVWCTAVSIVVVHVWQILLSHLVIVGFGVGIVQVSQW